jgi:hypothetical protein
MESRTKDLETVSRLRSARISVVNEAKQGCLDVLTHDGDSLETQVYLVKLLDVFPGLGKVAGRRLMSDLGFAPLVKVAQLTSEQKKSLISALGLNNG